VTERPPYKRNSKRWKKRMRSTGRRRSGTPKVQKIGMVIVLVVGYSLLEFVTTGAVNWPYKLVGRSAEEVGDYATRPEAGWRHAADAVDDLASKREGHRVSGVDLSGRVVRVADGDTISVLDSDNVQHKVRFFGIDAPERDQPHGDAARDALARMVEDRSVGVVIVQTDDYGRTVGTVYVDDRNINHALVEKGHAWWYRYYAPNERHLEAAEMTARLNSFGLWREENPIAPWDWRRGRR
jgi:endonuclease YncB( thermonuclease family)